MKRLLILFGFFIYSFPALFAQGEIDEQQRIFFRNERSFAVLLNSDGVGLNYREAKRIDYRNKRFWEVEAGTIKHPREYRLSNPYFQTTGTFVFGKLNSVFYLRGSFGHQKELFRKADLGGVAIRYFYSGGPVLAVYKPIYYQVLYPISSNLFELREEKFDVQIHHPYDIYSKASFFKGFNEIKALPGLYVKGGLNFEYSKEDKLIHAIEVGAQVSAFIKEVPIMATDDNRIVFFSLFASYRFGVVIDPLNPESNKFSYIFRRKRSSSIY